MNDQETLANPSTLPRSSRGSRVPETLSKEMKAWRRHLHSCPEFGFEEVSTSAYVAGVLKAIDLDEIVEGVGGTGIVATLRRGDSPRTIALRADMDALRIQEQSALPYASRTPGLMHACGHDGHTAMLLGAARLLASEPDFDGTVRFIFQPAEEWGQGAQAMLDDGLLQRFPFDEIYGLHNMPGLPVGRFETRPGALMSAEDNFEITLTGKGGHAARPHWGNEVMVGACSLVTSLQTIVSRRLDPTDIAVVSVTEFLTDGTRNVLPGKARILGDCRSFHSGTSALIEQQMRIIAQGVALAFNLEVEVDYSRVFVPLINNAELVEEALCVAREVCDPTEVRLAAEPMTASEDFARFLEYVPGCFAFIGNGVESPPLHNAEYDFNDSNLVLGARYLAEMAKRRLAQTNRQ